jgi:guanylate kinase
MSIRKAFGSAVLIFIVPPSLEELRRRLVVRGTDKADTIRQRMVDAEPELQEMQNYDYAVPNRDVAEAVGKLKAIVTAERLRICKFRRQQP